jgi:uncharacterized membrane protein
LASRLYTAFVAAAATWALLLLLAPLVASRSHASAFGTALVVAVYAVGSVVCHQLPERSFHLWMAQMPVCARCTGIYFGAAAMAIAIGGSRASGRRARLKGSRSKEDGSRSTEPQGIPSETRARESRDGSLALRRRALQTLALAVAPTLATLAFEWTTGHTPANWIRFAAGVPIGVAVAWLLRAAAENQVN